MIGHSGTFTGFQEKMREVRYTGNFIGDCEVAYSRVFADADTHNPLASMFFSHSRSVAL